MKTKTKFVIGISVVVLLIGGGIVMTETKTPFNIWKSTEPQSTEGKQLDYLKDHEQEMTDFIQSQHPKVTSVQYDWDSMDVGTTGNGTPQGAGEVLTLDGKFNNIKNSQLMLSFALKNKNALPSVKTMYMDQSLSILKNGGWYDYE